MYKNTSTRTRTWIIAGGLVLVAALAIRGTMIFLMSFGAS